MRPIIGITTNHSPDEKVGKMTALGLPGQQWQLVASDYVDAVDRAGGCPVIIPLVSELSSLKPLIGMLDGILFTGGSDIDPYYYGELPSNELGDINADRDRHEFELCQYVLANTQIPVMGICRGCQMVNVASGGTLYQDIRATGKATYKHNLFNFPKWYKSQNILIEPGSKLHEIFGQDVIRTNGFNHQAVKEPGEGLRVTMRTEDGFPMGYESTGERYITSVQWHPEMMLERSEEYLVFFKAFVEACKGK